MLLVCALAACASLTPVAPPTVTVIAVGLDRVERAQAVFSIVIELANSNPTDLEISGLDASVTIEDQRVATAALVSPVRVPAGGSATAELVARTGMDAILRATAAAIMRGAAGAPGHAPAVRYLIEGHALFGSGLRVPFSRAGELGHDEAR